MDAEGVAKVVILIIIILFLLTVLFKFWQIIDFFADLKAILGI